MISPSSTVFSNRISLQTVCSSARTEKARGLNYSGGATAAETLYDVLQVATEATTAEIKAAYRQLARSRHPDVIHAEDRTGAEFMKIHAAYSTLSDPKKRAEYDGLIVSSRSTLGYRRRRTWETDQCW